MPDVYLPAVAMRTDPETGARVPTLDVSAAAEFGNMIVLLRVDRPIRPEDMPSALTVLRKMLAAIRADDYIVAIGDPVLIAAAVAQAVALHGRAQMLRWDRVYKHYQRIEVTL